AAAPGGGCRSAAVGPRRPDLHHRRRRPRSGRRGRGCLAVAALILSPAYFARAQRISTSATSGRENSTGGRSPLASMSRTCVPDRLIWSPSFLGYVLGLTIPPADLLHAVCSTLRIVFPRSFMSMWSK